METHRRCCSSTAAALRSASASRLASRAAAVWPPCSASSRSWS
jgi:hypothetical protein